MATAKITNSTNWRGTTEKMTSALPKSKIDSAIINIIQLSSFLMSIPRENVRDDDAASCCHSDLFSASGNSAAVSILVYSFLLAIQLLDCPPLRLPTSKIHWMTILDRVLQPMTCPSYNSFHLFTTSIHLYISIKNVACIMR